MGAIDHNLVNRWFEIWYRVLHGLIRYCIMEQGRRRGDALSSNGKSSSASAAEHELSGGTWLAAEDMARLRLTQRRWAASLQAQQQRVRPWLQT